MNETTFATENGYDPRSFSAGVIYGHSERAGGPALLILGVLLVTTMTLINLSPMWNLIIVTLIVIFSGKIAAALNGFLFRRIVIAAR